MSLFIYGVITGIVVMTAAMVVALWLLTRNEPLVIERYHGKD